MVIYRPQVSSLAVLTIIPGSSCAGNDLDNVVALTCSAPKREKEESTDGGRKIYSLRSVRFQLVRRATLTTHGSVRSTRTEGRC